MKNAVLITIGDEILSGITVDTNSNFIASQLKDIGITVSKIFTISDNEKDIVSTLDEAFRLADVVFTTGGLGPTKDDITKKAYAKYFDDELIFSDDIYEHLRKYLEQRKRLWILEHNKEQAVVLSKAKIFNNYYGTAPCMMLEKNGKFCFSLPGVPYEVKPLVRDQIIPFLKEQWSLENIISRIVSVVDIPESILSEKIESWELSLPQHISLSYLPIGTRVKLRLTATGLSSDDLSKELEYQIQKLSEIIGDNIIGTREDKIEKLLGEIMTERNLSISTAESCTGGEVAHLLTSNPGSSKYYLGGLIAYATDVKINVLNVEKQIIDKYTVVSEEVALEMARGCQNFFSTDIAISTTGVAGPGKGEDGKDVGTVYYAIRYQQKEVVNKLYLPHLDRLDFMNFVSQRILQDVVSIIIEK